ncbi:MAG: phosphoribosyltransferase [Deltaproteobacteria bacterium]|nr:phosphoribosyltransferase [Deltaproteobacteria bacterium]MBW2071889.1 phosphoribosyltransferase [Deltaproteobacteria bacterium]
MSVVLGKNIHDVVELRERTGVFRDRSHAGEVLAELLEGKVGRNPLVLAIPAGGIPVGVSLARRLELPLDVAVVSKITLPWNTECGYGAVAFDGTVKVNEELVRHFGLRKEDIQQGVEMTERKVEQRFRTLRGRRPFPNLSNRWTVVVDDGLASGSTLEVAVAALRNSGAEKLFIAVPTAHRHSLLKIARKVEGVFCANIRGGWSFAVADAYQRWTDVTEEELQALLAEYDAVARRE